MHPARIGPLSRNGYEIADDVEQDREPRGTTRGDRWRHALLTWAVVMQWIGAFTVVITIAAATFAWVAGRQTNAVPMMLLVNGSIVASGRLASWAIKRNWWWAQ